MTDYDRSALVAELKRDEGFRVQRYRDSLGYWTIGYGHLLPKDSDLRYVTRERAEEMLLEDIAEAEKVATELLPKWREFDGVRQRAVLNLAFNMGYKLRQFFTGLPALNARDWERAAASFGRSLWAKQVGARATRVIHMIRHGRTM